MNVKLSLDCSPGVFYEVGNGFFLPTKSVPQGTELSVDQRLPVSCMFDVHIATMKEERCGFFFTTRFSVTNGGGYLLTALKGKEEATEVETLVRDDNLVLYHYPNKGTLAISPKVNDDIETIFTEQ